MLLIVMNLALIITKKIPPCTDGVCFSSEGMQMLSVTFSAPYAPFRIQHSILELASLTNLHHPNPHITNGVRFTELLLNTKMMDCIKHVYYWKLQQLFVCDVLVRLVSCVQWKHRLRQSSGEKKKNIDQASKIAKKKTCRCYRERSQVIGKAILLG